MELANDFRVSVPPQQAFAVLTDVERIAPLLPGAQLQEVEGDDYRGVVKVKVGPITAQYKGTATFLERDEQAGRVVLKATGRDTRGQGNANATITATLVGDGGGTKVSVVTDLTITGKVAQFGRGVLADVSGKLIGQFVDALERDLSSGAAAPVGAADAVAAPAASPVEAGEPLVGEGADAESAAAPPTPPTSGVEAVAADGPVGAGTTAPLPEGAAATPPAAGGVRRIDAPEPEPVDLLDAAGGSVAKRLLPLLGVGAAVVVVLLARRLRARRR
ncbi:MAG TPA: SRPBCC family protein [Acidimicrobiales bacterium]|nr:SRPBCC family protein [Acidimicrobiales bacterium]